jgi:transcriptional regulator with XRE-family HTH domain
VLAHPDTYKFDKQTLAGWLKEMREHLQVSSRELAAQTGVSPSQVLRCETTEFGFSVEVLIRLTRGLGVPVGLLIEAITHPAWEPYLERAEKDTFLKAATAKARAESNVGPGVLPRFVACCAAFAEQLLLSSNPMRWVHVTEFPAPAIEQSFQTHAQDIEKHQTPIMRHDAMRELASDPFRYLHQHGICDDLSFREFLRTEPSPTFTWNPFKHAAAFVTGDPLSRESRKTFRYAEQKAKIAARAEEHGKRRIGS